MTCDRIGLIGKELFAIDGVKLPGNASKEAKWHTPSRCTGRTAGEGGGEDDPHAPGQRREQGQQELDERRRQQVQRFHW